jgi:hypothetical protein
MGFVTTYPLSGNGTDFREFGYTGSSGDISGCWIAVKICVSGARHIMFCEKLQNFTSRVLSTFRCVLFQREKFWKNAEWIIVLVEIFHTLFRTVRKFCWSAFKCYSMMARIKLLPAASQHTAIFLGGKGRPARKADNLTAICESIV